MASPFKIQPKYEVRSITNFYHAKDDSRAYNHHQIVYLYGNTVNRQNTSKWCSAVSECRTDVLTEHRGGKLYVISDHFSEEQRK